MSVIKRYRSESKLETYNTARTIRAEVTRLVMNEKVVPKRYRPVLTFPMTSLLVKLINNIIAANTIYLQKPKEPVNAAKIELALKEALKRREYQTEAIITIEQIFQQLQYILDTVPADPDKFETVTKLLLKEGELLRGWRNTDFEFIKDLSGENTKDLPSEKVKDLPGEKVKDLPGEKVKDLPGENTKEEP